MPRFKARRSCNARQRPQQGVKPSLWRVRVKSSGLLSPPGEKITCPCSHGGQEGQGTAAIHSGGLPPGAEPSLPRVVRSRQVGRVTFGMAIGDAGRTRVPNQGTSRSPGDPLLAALTTIADELNARGRRNPQIRPWQAQLYSATATAAPDDARLPETPRRRRRLWPRRLKRSRK
jgi:hypothetical protein